MYRYGCAYAICFIPAKKRIAKNCCCTYPYVGILLLLILLIFPLIPFFVAQIKSLLTGFPEYVRQSGTTIGITIDEKNVQDFVTREFNSIGRNAFAVTTKVFGGLFSILTVLVVSFYLLMDHGRFKVWIASFFDINSHDKVISVLRQVDDKLGAWLRGQIMLSTSIGVMTFIALSIIGFPNAVPLSLIAGILETIPTLGPILSAVPAIIIALTISPSMAFLIIGLYIIIQALENNILVPKIMQRAVGLNPVVVIIGVIIGANLLGVAGALLSIPFISLLTVLYRGFSSSSE
ncbi:MAG: AI-2E family transporter [Candidatus Levybacteria bacterium]|nr:AI-2E family transporter [Candidatus Levybacteria bacterium]